MTTHDDSTDQPPTPQPLDAVDESRRRFLLTTAGVLGGVGALCALTPLASSWLPSTKTRVHGGPLLVDISHLKPGEQMTVVWRGKPIWIIRRTPAMLTALASPNPELRDPLSLVPQQPPFAENAYRSIRPEYLVLVGICTHLGCAPLYKPQEHEPGSTSSGGFYCPCHGSAFDLSGRVFKHMPAPINLEVPPYRFIGEHQIEIGEGVA